MNADHDAYPPPTAKGWGTSTVAAILGNPKYTGYMVFGRTRAQAGQRGRRTPPEAWMWSPTQDPSGDHHPRHWDAAQAMGEAHGTSRDGDTLLPRAQRTYLLRGRVRHRTCQRRMHGATRWPPPATTPAPTSP